ncbi:hypothetical protein BN4901_4800 [Citrobacter europaeus]|uniref:Uncharacterized protein n=1 Tax=Citrobacter europaeus TaxID=1914243 RepID=A0ABY0JVY4_9ENTR|nr:hypothetical protein CIP106467_1235 [Citrobacter europaeus]SBW28567.1 hypothetical protein BN4901_4800 [Citrobacter europaeus]
MLFHHYSFNTILKNKEEMPANNIYRSHDFSADFRIYI